MRLDTIHLVRVEREQIRERSDRSFLVMQTIWNHVDPKVGFIIDERLAISVYDPSSTRRNKRQVYPIAFKQQLIMFVFRSADPSHAAGEQYADGPPYGANHPCAASEGTGLRGARTCFSHSAARSPICPP